MKKNSGSALTSVIVVFLLVTMIGVPLLSTVVYNYRLREYDSGIKEAEYKNEVVMDRISTIIKNAVITAISNAKDNSTSDIATITDTLVNSYNSAYDLAYDAAIDEVAQYDASNNITNLEAVNTKVKENLRNDLASSLGEFDGVTKEDIVSILDIDNNSDFSNAKINDEKLQALCNSIFQKKYQDELLDDVNGIFEAIYVDSEYDDLAVKRFYGGQNFETDSETGKTLESSLRITSKYTPHGDDFKDPYILGSRFNNAEFEVNGVLYLGIVSEYKLNKNTPLSTLSATFVIGTPDFNMISSIEQQTVALSNPTLDYGLIVGDTLTVNGNVQVDGNILARANKSSTVERGIILKPGATLKEKTIDGGNSTGRIATSGDIVVDTESGKTTTLETGSNPIYYRNLYLGDPINQKSAGTIDVVFNGDVLAKDDLEINLNSTVNVTQNGGSYFGYNDKNDEGPDSSSAIVINSNNINGIDVKLNNLYLYGRAFIEGVRSTTRVDNNNNNMIYKTGESISIKGNYIAYQTPVIGTGDYNGDGVTGDYDVNKVKFSPYFMKGNKDGIDGETNLTINLVDNFIDEISYENFDSGNKWQYFREYYNKYTDSIKKPKISIPGGVKYIEGAGVITSGLVPRNDNDKAKATMITKGKRFEEFTSYFGYYPEDETKRKDKITDWIKFGSTEKLVKDGNFFTWISSGTKSLSWGTTSGNTVVVDSSSTGVNGIVLHNGDLTITGDSSIPFRGIIIVNGNLTINGNTTIISDKEAVSEIIIQNYLGDSGYVYGEGDASNELGEGDLFNKFTYDGSGTTYVAIDVTDKSNMIDINELVGITNWKKQNYGRL